MRKQISTNSKLGSSPFFPQSSGDMQRRKSASRGPGKSVRFSTKNEYFETHCIKKPLSRKIWYSESEIREMRRVVLETLKNGDFQGENEEHTYRGLEVFNGKRMGVSVLSIEAVLKEQERQKIIGIHDVNAIAEVYRSTGAKASQETAIATGKSDHHISIQCLRDSGQDHPGKEKVSISAAKPSGSLKLRKVLSRWPSKKLKAPRAA